MGTQWKHWQTVFSGLQDHSDGDCSHEIKRCLLLGRKAMTNLDSILKSRDIILSTKVHIVKAMISPVVMYGCKSWTIKKAERRRIDAFELWCWRRLLRVPWPAMRPNQSIPKGINPEHWLERHAETETPIFWPPDAKNQLIRKDPELGKIESRKSRQQRMRQLDGIINWWTWVWEALGGGQGQGSLPCCSQWGHKESETTERLNNNNKSSVTILFCFLF